MSEPKSPFNKADIDRFARIIEDAVRSLGIPDPKVVSRQMDNGAGKLVWHFEVQDSVALVCVEGEIRTPCVGGGEIAYFGEGWEVCRIKKRSGGHTTYSEATGPYPIFRAIGTVLEWLSQDHLVTVTRSAHEALDADNDEVFRRIVSTAIKDGKHTIQTFPETPGFKWICVEEERKFWYVEHGGCSAVIVEYDTADGKGAYAVLFCAWMREMRQMAKDLQTAVAVAHGALLTYAMIAVDAAITGRDLRPD